MTDRERLLEQVRDAEERAAQVWKWLLLPRRGPVYTWMTDEQIADEGAQVAMFAAHHALTALALRDLIEYRDKVENTGFIYHESSISAEETV